MGNKKRLQSNMARIKPRPLQWKQLTRLADIFCYQPCQSMPGDEVFIECGLIKYYDGDTDIVEVAEGAEEALYQPPYFRVRDAWRGESEAEQHRTFFTKDEIETNNRPITNNHPIE